MTRPSSSSSMRVTPLVSIGSSASCSPFCSSNTLLGRAVAAERVERLEHVADVAELAVAVLAGLVARRPWPGSARAWSRRPSAAAGRASPAAACSGPAARSGSHSRLRRTNAPRWNGLVGLEVRDQQRGALQEARARARGQGRVRAAAVPRRDAVQLARDRPSASPTRRSCSSSASVPVALEREQLGQVARPPAPCRRSGRGRPRRPTRPPASAAKPGRVVSKPVNFSSRSHSFQNCQSVSRVRSSSNTRSSCSAKPASVASEPSSAAREQRRVGHRLPEQVRQPRGDLVARRAAAGRRAPPISAPSISTWFTKRGDDIATITIARTASAGVRSPSLSSASSATSSRVERPAIGERAEALDERLGAGVGERRRASRSRPPPRAAARAPPAIASPTATPTLK